MTRDHASDMQVATATGQGAGRFLVAALLDALDGGALIEIDDTAAPPQRVARGIDFVFATVDGATSEVIRAGTNQRSELVCAQLLRRPAALRGPELSQAGELARHLRGAKSIGKLLWQSREDGTRTLEVVLLPQRVTVRLDGIAAPEGAEVDDSSPARHDDETAAAQRLGVEE